MRLKRIKVAIIVSALTILVIKPHTTYAFGFNQTVVNEKQGIFIGGKSY